MSYFHTIYKTTNLVNGKIYIGKHQTDNLDDNYLGSGKYLSRAIAKYGRENFKKEILFIFDNEIEMNAKEKEIVSEAFISSSSNYNARVGGEGGFSSQEAKLGYVARNITSDELSKQGKNGYYKSLNLLSKDQIKANGQKGGRSNAGKPKSTSHKTNLSKSIKGRSFSYPTNRKSRNIIFETVSCPHCEIKGKKNAMMRWHFDNCKNKT